MVWLVNYIRRLFCSHGELKELHGSGVHDTFSTIFHDVPYTVLYCTKCGYSKKIWIL